MNPVGNLVNRMIFPNGLRQPARRTASRVAGEATEAAAKSSFRTLGTFNTADGFRMVGLPTVNGVPVPVPTAVTFREGAGRRGDWVIRPERVDVLGIPVPNAVGSVREAMAHHAQLRPEGEAFRVAIAGSRDFQVLWTRKTSDGIRMVGLPRLRGIPLPIPTAVEFSRQAASFGRFALKPERVTIAGIPSRQGLEAVTRALGENPGLRREGEVFRVLMG